MNELALTPETQVREIAARYPATLRMLEALKIDYCCGGKLPLSEAAEQANVPVDTVISVLQAAIVQASAAPGGERDWARSSLEDLIAHILDSHHTYMHSELPRLDEMLALITRVHGPNHGDILYPLQEKYRQLKAELEAHLEKEEKVAFPSTTRLLAKQGSDGLAKTIAELGAEHDAAGEALAAMRQITRDYDTPNDVCGSYCAVYDGLQALERDIHQHIHLENNILFPRTLELLHDCKCSS